MILSDWSDEAPDTIFANLKRSPQLYNINARMLPDWQRDVRDNGISAARAQRAMWNRMRMSDSRLSDVTGSTYIFLINGRTPADGWVAEFSRGEKVLLRFLNAGAAETLDVIVEPSSEQPYTLFCQAIDLL